MNYEELKNLALESGFTHAAPLDTATIELKQDVRDMCAQGCQQYAKRWSCPPGCGTLDQLRGSIYCYKEGILVQTVTKLEDEFDCKIAAAVSKCLFISGRTCNLCQCSTFSIIV